jgi:hypothetical protein
VLAKIDSTNYNTQWVDQTGGGGGGGLTNGDKGDIVVAALGESLLFDPNVVTAAAKTVLDDTTVAAMRTTLGLGSLATKSTIVSADITDGTVANVDLATMAANTVKMNNTAGVASPTDVTTATLKTVLGLTGTNSGDQTSIVGITGTLAQFNTAISDADVPAALNGLTGVWQGTQAQYTALGTYTSTVLYAVLP